MEKLEVIKACIILMEHSVSNQCSGGDIDIDTHKGVIHFTYDFTIDFKNSGATNEKNN